MGVDELPSGRFRARVTIDGRRHQETFPDRGSAEDWLTVTRARAITGTLPGRITVREYGARWILTYDVGPASTRDFHESNLRLYVYPAFGPRPMKAVAPSDVTRMLNRIRETVSAAKADSVYRTLSALLRSAEQDDVIVASPVRSKRHRPKLQKGLMPVLERQQARQTLLKLGGWVRDTAVLQLAFGPRFGEVAGLTPHDVHGNQLDIVRRVYGTGRNATVRATKNHRRRTLEVPKSARTTIDRLVVQAMDPEPIPDLEDREWPAGPWRKRWLVQTSTGYPPNLAAYNRALKKATAGLPLRNRVESSHGLRHTYVSWMIDDGHSADQVAFWIGDTPETVRRVYAHMLEGSSSPAAASVDAALGDLG